MADPFHREPCMWTSTVPNFNTADRERVSQRDGKVVRERIPQTGTVGDYDNRQPVNTRRWLPVVRHEGHVVPHVYTNAAAHMDTSTSYAQNEMAVDRALGWFWTGSCPVALIGTGLLSGEQIVDKSLIEARPCAPGSFSEDKPCPHVLAEKTARMKQTAETERERAASYKDPTDRMIDAQREQQAALITALTADKDKARK